MPKVRFVLKANKPVIYDLEVEVPHERCTDEALTQAVRRIWEDAPESVGFWKDDPSRQWALSEFSTERSYEDDLQ